jgi:hypothetical protein
MALAFGAVTAKFKMPGSPLQESFMDKACGQEAFESAINRDFVQPSRSKLRSNLACRLRFAGTEQNA